MQKDEPVQLFADLLRGRHGIDNRTAVLGQHRVEFMRGKDFARFIAANPDKVTLAVAKGKSPEEQAQEIGNLLLRRDVMYRVDRMYKKPAPGMDRLIKFPKKLVRVTGQEATVFSPEGFYAWNYDRPTSPWVYFMSFLAAIGVILVCLFPMAPYSVKISVVYLSASILVVMLGTLSLRTFIALTTWITTGTTLWLLPNLLADDKPISQLFTPLLEVQKPDEKASKWSNHILVRLAVAGLLAVVCWVLYAHAPDKGAVKDSAAKYRDEFFDMLDLHKPALEGEVGVNVNVTGTAENLNVTGSESSGQQEAAGGGHSDEL